MQDLTLLDPALPGSLTVAEIDARQRHGREGGRHPPGLCQRLG